MANICTNRLYLSTKDKQIRDSFAESMKELFYYCDTQEFDNGEVFNCEMVFDSRWKFPQEEMEELTGKLPKDNDLCIHVISYEFDNEYAGFNIYIGGGWCDKLADR